MKHKKNRNLYCLGCSHYRSFYEGLYACHYCIDTGISRNCKPGQGCIHYTTEKVETQQFQPICLKL